MQIHNFGARQTIFAYNNFSAGGNADIGIGNQPSGNPDWTFSANAKNCEKATLYVFVNEVPRDDTKYLDAVKARVPEAASMRLAYAYDLRSGSGFGRPDPGPVRRGQQRSPGRESEKRSVISWC